MLMTPPMDVCMVEAFFCFVSWCLAVKQPRSTRGSPSSRDFSDFSDCEASRPPRPQTLHRQQQPQRKSLITQFQPNRTDDAHLQTTSDCCPELSRHPIHQRPSTRPPPIASTGHPQRSRDQDRHDTRPTVCDNPINPFPRLSLTFPSFIYASS
ncbi:hypothetical protein LIA77_01098 [Sarocladium implicatum]|nr:hypothetical protein LIA77_01098 [Sarocladium implicatum]